MHFKAQLNNKFNVDAYMSQQEVLQCLAYKSDRYIPRSDAYTISNHARHLVANMIHNALMHYYTAIANVILMKAMPDTHRAVGAIENATRDVISRESLKMAYGNLLVIDNLYINDSNGNQIGFELWKI